MIQAYPAYQITLSLLLVNYPFFLLYFHFQTLKFSKLNSVCLQTSSPSTVSYVTSPPKQHPREDFRSLSKFFYLYKNLILQAGLFYMLNLN